MEDWKEYKLSDIMSLIGGGTPKTSVPEYWDGDIPWISVKDFNGERRFVGITEKTITQAGLDNSSTKILSKGDVIISARGTVGELAIIPSDMAFNQSCYGLRAKEFVDPTFLYYLLKQSVTVLKHNTHGSVFDTITKETFEGININLPPLPTQQKIAQILSSLDDKIELNNKINANLEQQAQALFKSWFVDFEPFGGEMPAGWKVGTIGDLCSTVSQTYKGNDSEVVLINTSDVENGDILNHESVANTNLKGQFKKTFQKNDILYSEIRPANRHYAFVDIDETCNYIASTKLMVIRPNEDVNPHYLYHILTNPELIKEMQHLAETRSGTFPQITFESELSTYQIPLLPKEEQDKLGNLFEKIDNMVFHNIRENKKLSNLRDTLLPKLMNGEIEV